MAQPFPFYAFNWQITHRRFIETALVCLPFLLLPPQPAMQHASTPASSLHAVVIVAVPGVFAAALPALAFPWKHIEEQEGPRTESYRQM